MISTLISIYENSITVNVVVPLIPKPFSSTRELYNNNYTFVVQEANLLRAYNWLSDEYNTVNNRRVLSIRHFSFLSKWLGVYFLNNDNEKNYAIVGYLSKQFHFCAVSFLKEKHSTGHQIYPTEGELYPKPVYLTFASPVASLLYKGSSLLLAHGFTRAFQTAENFRESLTAFNYTRPLVFKYENGITYADLKRNRIKENTITFDNIKSVVYVGIILIISSCVAFVAEVCSKEMVFMMLIEHKTLRYSLS